jgi:hypothetical protein
MILQLTLVAAVLTAQDSMPRLVPPKIGQEAYELYSFIYRSPTHCDPLKSEEVLAIGATTVEVPEWMLRELKPRSAEERAMVDSLRRLGSAKFKWEERFNFGRSYRLLNDEEARVAGRCMYREEFGQAQCTPYIWMEWVRGFSLPSFNRNRTRALVYTSRGREAWGGSAELIEYWKSNAGWRREDHGFVSGNCAKF